MQASVVITDQPTRAALATVTFSASEPAQPWRINWGDGTAVDGVAAGTTTKTHTYAKDGFYKASVQGNEVRIDQNLMVGQMMPAGRNFAPYQESIQRDLKMATATGKLG